MGLPQELVDHIVDVLHDDPPALKACSLTCRAMFASTRHLIHQTLCLTMQNNERVLTQEEKKKLRQKRWNYQNIQLRFLSHMSERGLLQYARRIFIRNDQPEHIPNTFAPDTLLPHLRHFQSLDRVHTLTIERYDADLWKNHYKRCFGHFSLTLTSLTLRRPSGHHQPLFQFILQFRNLENLCLEWLDGNARIRPDVVVPTLINQTLPVGRHLRLARIDGAVEWPMEFADELRRKLKFRSVELEDSFGDHGWRFLSEYARTVEYLTIIPSKVGTYRLSLLQSCARDDWLIFLLQGFPG